MFKDVKYAKDLSFAQLKERKDVFQKFVPILTTEQGSCSLNIEHEIELTTDQPVFRKQYLLPFELLKAIETEVKSMLEMGGIEPLCSPFSTPVV